MRIVKLPFAIVTVVGLAVSLYTGYLFIRGPFLGGKPLPMDEPVRLLGTFGAFLVGIILLTWGMVKWFDVGSRL